MIDWGAVLVGAVSGVAAAVVAVATLRTDVRWLKGQVNGLWDALDKIAPRPVVK